MIKLCIVRQSDDYLMIWLRHVRHVSDTRNYNCSNNVSKCYICIDSRETFIYVNALSSNRITLLVMMFALFNIWGHSQITRANIVVI